MRETLYLGGVEPAKCHDLRLRPILTKSIFVLLRGRAPKMSITTGDHVHDKERPDRNQRLMTKVDAGRRR